MKLTLEQTPSEPLLQLRMDSTVDGEVWIEAKRACSPDWTLLMVFTAKGEAIAYPGNLRASGFAWPYELPKPAPLPPEAVALHAIAYPAEQCEPAPVVG